MGVCVQHLEGKFGLLLCDIRLEHREPIAEVFAIGDELLGVQFLRAGPIRLGTLHLLLGSFDLELGIH